MSIETATQNLYGYVENFDYTNNLYRIEQNRIEEVFKLLNSVSSVCHCKTTAKRDIILGHLSGRIKEINMKLVESTDPSSLSVHMNAPDMLCQIRTAVEALWTEVPAAGVGHRLSP